MTIAESVANTLAEQFSKGQLSWLQFNACVDNLLAEEAKGWGQEIVGSDEARRATEVEAARRKRSYYLSRLFL